jgi:DNA repair photolyase
MPRDAHPPLGPIERKSLLYKSGLGFWCINHVQGCSHGCRYPCHAFMIFNRHGRVRDYADWCQPRLVANALQLLDRELARKRQRPDQVHLCLSTDPFMAGYPEVQAISLAIIERLNEAGIACSVLTKGILPADLADRARFPVTNTHGISLVSLDEDFRRQWEPGAAPYADRIAALRRLHEAGRQTRVHIEPYPTPNIIEQDLRALLEAVAFVDRVFFGGWNYNHRVTDYPDAVAFYREQVAIVRRFCEMNGIEREVT